MPKLTRDIALAALLIAVTMATSWYQKKTPSELKEELHIAATSEQEMPGAFSTTPDVAYAFDSQVAHYPDPIGLNLDALNLNLPTQKTGYVNACRPSEKSGV